MISFAWYGLQVIACSAVMMGYYWLVLRNKRFHRYNRFYILVSVMLSFLIPVVKIQLDNLEARNRAIQIMYVFAGYNSSIDAVVAAKGHTVNWMQLAGFGYLIVSLFFVVMMIRALVKIYKLFKKYPGKKFQDVWLIYTNASGTPFSFFRYIFWNEDINLDTATGQQVLQHELIHVQEKHSTDTLIMQLVLVIGWCNPFFWLARKELHMIHEFIADQHSVEAGDTASFAAMLLAAAYPRQQYLLTHPFFFSPIKRRLLMLTNSKNPRFSYVRRVMILPLMAIVAVLFAFRTANHPKNVKQPGGKIQLSSFPLSDTTIKNVTASDSTVLILKEKAAKDSAIQNGSTVIRFYDPTKPQALIVVDGKKINKDYLSQLEPRDIASINVLKDRAALDKYGAEGKNGVLEVTLKKSNVLYVVDGKQIPNALKEIDPASIESINVLKDKTALDKYGAEGQNGVVEITLKKVKPLYVLDGKQMQADFDIATINPPDIERVNVWTKDQAIAKYGEAGKNGVVEITSKLATLKLTDKVFTEPEIPASFPGGKTGWQKYLERNLNRDLPVKNGAPAGKYTVNMNFIVDQNGNISNLVAENDPGYGTKDEALRVIQKGPDWVPAEQNGKKVTSLVKQSITFFLFTY